VAGPEEDDTAFECPQPNKNRADTSTPTAGVKGAVRRRSKIPPEE
jgi:hypothetical protein